MPVNPIWADGVLMAYSAANGIIQPSVPIVYDAVNQQAAIGSTTFITPVYSGMSLVTVYAVVTVAATTSSTLGPITFTFTGVDTSSTITLPVVCSNQQGVMTTIASNNAIGTFLAGSAVLHPKAGTAINFTMGYASSGATKMKYALHLKYAYLGA
jgi:hypothetical protein